MEGNGIEENHREIAQVHGFFDQSDLRFVQPGWNRSHLHEKLPFSVVAHMRMHSSRSSASRTSFLVEPIGHEQMERDSLWVWQEDVSGSKRGRKLSAPIEDSAVALHIGDEVRVPFLRGAR